jgi:molecular chaperone DnaK
MIKDAQAHADEDKRRREEVEVRNTADSTAYQVERQIRELGERVAPNEKARAEQAINEIRAQLKNDSADVPKLRQLTSDLQQIAHSLSSAAYAQTTAAGAGAGGTNGGRPTGAEDVIDAEFKETR